MYCDECGKELPDGRGVLLQLMGNRDAAIADYRKALELDPDYTEAQEALNKLGV